MGRDGKIMVYLEVPVVLVKLDLLFFRFMENMCNADVRKVLQTCVRAL